MLIDKSKFSNNKEIIKFIIENKQQLIAQKKAVTKHADGFSFNTYKNSIRSNDAIHKGNSPILNPSDEINVLAVINTTNWFDSHEDVHIPGIWNKTLQENKNILHVQEHKASEFDKIIASKEDLSVYTKSFLWSELGYNIQGNTEALVFDSKVKKSRNAYMHEQYAKGYVDNHSVGMRYVKLVFCCNDSDFGAEYEAYQKYIQYVANKEDVETNGYFWAVTEAKLIEGSAVPLGSNIITPTLQNNKQEPSKTLDIQEPQNNALDLDKLINLL